MNFAIIGCGHIAVKHVEAIQACEGAVLRAVFDTNRINAERIAGPVSAKVHDDLDDMLRDPVIDAVCICTPSGLHVHQAVKAACAGKHVVVEKPIALTLEDADTMIRACRDNGVKLTVVHPNRFRPAVVKLKKAVEEGRFGKLSHLNATVRWNRGQSYYDQAPWRGTREFDGGVLMNQAIHNLDLLLWLGGGVTEIKALAATRLRKIETEDVAAAVLRFESGALGVIEAASTVYPQNLEESLSIFGEAGSAIIGGTTANWIKHWRFLSESEEESADLIRGIEEDPFGIPGHHRIISDFTEAVLEGREPAVTGEDGRRALELVLKVYEAAGLSEESEFAALIHT